MKLTANRQSLLAAVQTVQSAVATKTTNPILTNIKITASQGAMTLAGTDTEVGIVYDLPGVTVDRPGEAIVPPDRLAAILKEGKDETVSIIADEKSTTVRLAAGHVKLPGADASEFPDPERFADGPDYHEVSVGVLRSLIGLVEFAVPRKDNSQKFSVTGFLWGSGEFGVRLSATETKRAAVAIGEAKRFGSQSVASAIVPLKALDILEKSMSDDGEQVRVSITDNTISFLTERTTVTSSLIAGRFPPLDKVVPKGSKGKAMLPREAFASHLRLAATAVDGTTKRVDFRIADNAITLTAGGAETGNAEFLFSVPYDGPDVSFGMDYTYILDIFKACRVETIQMDCISHDKPVVFRSGDNYLCLVMPLEK